MASVERAGRTVHFTRDGDGPGVVLLPGLGSGARLFGTLPRRFAREGFTCAAVDPVGMPPSSLLPHGVWDFEQAARDALAVAAELPSPVAIVGTSLGGKVALTAAALGEPAAAARMVMLCSSAFASARSKRVYRWFEIVGGELDPRWLGELTAPFLFGETFLAQRAAVVDDIVRATKPSPESRALMGAQARALQAFDGAAACARVRWPTLCLAGAEDTLTLPSEVAATAAAIPDARHEVVANAGHSLLLESAHAFDRVVAFLRER
jgi:pimeloyl-ACP methyl ester carboxylesterase